MSDPAGAPRGFRVHPLDLLVLLLAVGLAALAYAYLFRRSPVPRPVDRLLGTRVEAEFDVDRPWKATFPPKGEQVLIEDYLVADLVETGPVDGADGGRRRLVLRIRGREGQKPEALTLFRTGIHRGSSLRLTSGDSEVRAEVVSVGGLPAEGR